MAIGCRPTISLNQRNSLEPATKENAIVIYTQSFPIQFRPLAAAEAVVTGPNVRFTVLTARLLRLEYSPTGRFEDRPSQLFWYREQPVPEYRVEREDDRLTIETTHMLLNYTAVDGGFTAETLSITVKESGATWHHGQSDPANLHGTYRTLDRADGIVALEEGLISRAGWAVVDDTGRLLFDEVGWLRPRQAPKGYQDLYFFGYGRDYPGVLQDLALVAGPAPLIPRWALGNWWSRYWAYSADELLALMDDFRQHDIPLSVCIVDMDWHVTETGNAASGWTGYTWNRDLFPDPPAFLAELRRRGLKTALNLHPAEGIFPHEAQYPAMAAALGLNPAGRQPIPFNIADPAFTRAYFELLHHPHEAQGIDFWWMDWQQGTLTGLPGLDPLWWLNHLHFYDLGRDDRKRPFIFSRWGGLGNHRYPIGFSGDTHVTWATLAFQPCFTATAANVNYGWWSHDIGGHMGGIEEGELYARWVQFGILSPIMRFHSTKNPFHERRPWGYDAEVERVTGTALRLRQALIPYLYTMAWRNHTEHRPLVSPMYHDYPDQEPAYHCPDQYLFGSQLLAAPFTSPRDPDTRLSRQVVWLPPGEWYDFFSGRRYPGNGWQAIFGDLADIPLFARAGAVVPLAQPAGWSDTGNPAGLELHLFPGADNDFALYEDDGLSASSLTPIGQRWSVDTWQVMVGPVAGETAHLPAERSFSLLFRGLAAGAEFSVALNDRPFDLAASYDPATATLRLADVSLRPADTLTVNLQAGESLLALADHRLQDCQRLVAAGRLDSYVKHALSNDLPQILEEPAVLEKYELGLSDGQRRALLELLTGSGYDRRPSRRPGEERIILWNNHGRADAQFRLVGTNPYRPPVLHKGTVPGFAFLILDQAYLTFRLGSIGLETVNDWIEGFLSRPGLRLAGVGDEVVQFDIGGPGGRAAYLTIKDGAAHLTDGRHPSPTAAVTADAGDWLALINGQAKPEELFLAGKLELSGDLQLLQRLADVIYAVPGGTFAADQWSLEFDYLGLARYRLGPAGQAG
jgi:alpha-glucosidase (family GH31 glycosyl hydrolase)